MKRRCNWSLRAALIFGTPLLAHPAGAQLQQRPVAAQGDVDVFKIPPEVREPTADEQATLAKLWRAISFYQNNGGHSNALKELPALTALLEKTYGPEHPITLFTVLQRAASLAETRAHADAEKLYPAVIEKLSKRIGRDGGWYRDAVIGQTHNQIYQGWYTRAEALLAPLAASVATRFGPTSLEHAQLLANMAYLRYEQGRYADAEAMAREALAIRRRQLKAGHPLIASTVSRIAVTLSAQGRYEEADQLARAELGTRTDEDIGTARLHEAIGDTLFGRGKFIEAEKAYRQSATLLVDKAGYNSPEAAFAASKMRIALLRLGNRQRALSTDLPSIPTLECTSPQNLTELRLTQVSALYNGQLDAEIECRRKALAFIEERFGKDHPEAGAALTDLAEALHNEGRTDDAEAAIRRALPIREARLGRQHPETVRTLALFSAIMTAQGRGEEATTLALRAEQASSGALGGAAALSPLIQKAAALDNEGRHREAESIWEDIINNKAQTAEQNLPLITSALSGYAFNKLALGRCITGVHEALGKVVQDSRKINPYDVFPGNPLLEEVWAQSLACEGKWQEAAAQYQRVSQSHRGKVVGYQFRQQGLVEARHALTLAGNNATLKQAYDASRLAASIALERRYTPERDEEGNAVGKLRLAESEGGADPLSVAFVAQLKVNWALAQQPEDISKGFYGQSHGWEAFEAAQNLGISAAAQALLQAAARAPIKDPALSQMVRKQQNLTAEVSKLDRTLITTGDRVVPADISKLEQARSELTRLEAEIRARYPTYAELVRPVSARPKLVQDRLKPGEALLLVQPARDHVYVFGVGRSGFAWHKMRGTAAELGERVRKLRCLLDGISCRAGERRDDPFDRKLAFQLYSDVIAPVEKALQGAKQLYVVAGGDLGGLPLSLLVTKPPAAGEDDSDVAVLTKTEWLGDRYALVSLPSVSSLRAFERAEANYASKFAGFGDPVLGPPKIDPSAPIELKLEALGLRSATRGGFANVAALRQIPSLPNTRTELLQMAAALNVPQDSVRLGPAATEASVKSAADLKGARMIVFATHGLLPNELAGFGEPGLIFTPPVTASQEDDGVLTASEASALDLTAAWVVLSACNTASTDGSPGGESLSGLARSFLYAGARSVLASHWQVGDQIAAALTVQALQIAEANPSLSRGEAFQKAMQAVRTGVTPNGTRLPGWQPDWSDPWAWSPFVLIDTGS
jgi:CHAT domain-containing protein/tetratricopeptide (TPR) repeat protein